MFVRSERSQGNFDSESQLERSNEKFLAPGDRIIGVQYRRVRVQGHNSATMDSPFLDKKSQWRKYYRVDFPRTADNLEVDILEAELDEAPVVAGIRADVPGEFKLDVYHSM